MSDPRIELYEANIVRLEAQVERLNAGRKRLVWILGASLVVAFFAAIASWLVALAIALLGISIFGVGHYIALMHVTEDTDAIAIAHRSLEGLRAPEGQKAEEIREDGGAGRPRSNAQS